MKGASKRMTIEFQKGMARQNTREDSGDLPTPWYTPGLSCLRLSVTICTVDGSGWNENTGAGYEPFMLDPANLSWSVTDVDGLYSRILANLTPIQFAVATAAWPTIRQMAMWFHPTDMDPYASLVVGSELNPAVTLKAYEMLVFLGGDYAVNASPKAT